MNLEEFVTNVLIELDNAVEAARSKTKREVQFTSNKDNRTVEFDIAVTVENVGEKSGKAGLKVLQFVEGGGQISEVNKNSTISRVKFGVYLSELTKDERRAYGYDS